MPAPSQLLSIDRFAAALLARVDRRPATMTGRDRPTAPEERTPATSAPLRSGPIPATPRESSRVIAVDGWSGSGKTWLGDRLAAAMEAPCVHLDDWVPGWRGLRRSVELLVDWVLLPIATGGEAGWRCWDWDHDAFGPWQSLAPPPGGVIVVEGCGAGSPLARPWLSELVWLAADTDERERRLRARPDWALYQPWATIWADQERALRTGDDPAEAAGVVVETDDEHQNGRLVVRWHP